MQPAISCIAQDNFLREGQNFWIDIGRKIDYVTTDLPGASQKQELRHQEKQQSFEKQTLIKKMLVSLGLVLARDKLSDFFLEAMGEEGASQVVAKGIWGKEPAMKEGIQSPGLLGNEKR